MTPRKIGIGVAGLGRIGWSFHALSLAKHRDFRLVAVADTQRERRREAEQRLGCRSYAAFERMIEDEALEAVVIATPSHLHHEMAVAALRRGLHVLLEKPMASTYADAAAIAREARRAGRTLTVYQPHRLGAPFQHLLKLVRSGQVGPVTWAQLGIWNYVRRDDWQSLRRFGGGMLNNYGAHGLDQLLQIVGYDVERVFCQMQLVASLGDAEDVVKVVFATRRGAVGQLDVNQASALRPYELFVWGTRGAIEVRAQELFVRRLDPRKLPPKKLNRHLASAGRRYPRDDIPWEEVRVAADERLGVDVFKDFARAIRCGTPPAVPPEETLAVMKLIARCRECAGTVKRMR